MPSIVYCDRAPFHVRQSVSEVEHMITDAENAGAHRILYFDRLMHSSTDPAHSQVALRISRISSIVPCDERGNQIV